MATKLLLILILALVAPANAQYRELLAPWTLEQIFGPYMDQYHIKLKYLKRNQWHLLPPGRPIRLVGNAMPVFSMITQGGDLIHRRPKTAPHDVKVVIITSWDSSAFAEDITVYQIGP